MPAMSATPALPSQRLLSLDAFRGATIMGMILVNNPGSWGAMYGPLGHAEWHGWTPTDLVFPFFVFIMGAALAYSLRKYRSGKTVDSAVYLRILRRTLLLIGLGLAMGLFGRVCDILFQDADGLNLDTLRWPGVLQRIGLAYFAASMLALRARPRTQGAIAAAILLGYWGMLATWPSDVPQEQRLANDRNVVRAVDVAVLGKNHMYTQATTEPTDPEGLLSTLPTIVTALAGYWCGLVIQSRGATWRTAALLVACGLAIAAAGQLWHEWLPINKKLWTSSFVVLTGGLAAAGLGACLAVFDVLGMRRLGRPFEIAGVNAIFAFVGSGMLARLLGTVPWGETTVRQALYQFAFASRIADPKLASLAFALTTVAFWWVLLALMARRGWTIRV